MINVKVEDLKKKVDELLADGIEYVQVFTLESEEFQGDVIPATLHFSAYSGEGYEIDYEEIEEVKVNAFYKIEK